MKKISAYAPSLLSRYGIREGLERFRRAGFPAMAFGLDEMAYEENCRFNAPEWRQSAEQLRHEADEAGVIFNQTHSPFSWRGRDWVKPEFYGEIIRPAILRAMEISAILGASVMAIHPRNQYLYLGHEDEIFETNLAFFRDLIPYAKEFNIRLGIENIWQYDPIRKYIVEDTGSRVEEMIRYTDTLDSDRIVVCMDIGHTAVVRDKTTTGDYIRALGHDRLQELHVHDNDCKEDQHLPPYCGAINWNEVTQALGEIDYQGYFSYEVSGAWTRYMNDAGVDIFWKYLADIGGNLSDQIDANRSPKNC